MKPLGKTLAVVGALWPTYKLFSLSSGLVAAIATIPVMRTIDQLVDLPPVTAKIVGFIVVGAMLVVSWYVAEAVVLLAAIAVAGEVEDLIQKIKEAHQMKQNDAVTKARSNFSRFGAPYFASVEG